MSEKKNFASVLRVWLLAGLVGVLASACSLLGFAAWMASHHCSGSAAVPLAAAAVGLGSFCSGWVTAFCKQERGLFCGIAQGLWFAALLFVLALPSGVFTESAAWMRFAAVILCGSLGGFLGVRSHPKNISAEGRGTNDVDL